MPERLTADVAIVGGGPVGLTAALALAQAEIETALIARPTPADPRTTALLSSSVAALQTLGVWPACSVEAAPLRVLRIVDDTGRLIRAPEVSFSAAEIGLDAFGYNIENRHLIAALESEAQRLATLVRIADEALSIDLGADHATVALGNGGTVTARLLIGADGKRSICRAAAGIESDHASYPQTALTFNLRHTRPHLDTSTEFHTVSGPFTLVPLPGTRSSVVCVVEPSEADELLGLNAAALAAEIERRSHSILGAVTVEPNRGRFPLAIQTARRFAWRRVALVGEAAHLIPPIGAQGLNLGLRDAATIGELVVAGRRCGHDPGAAELLARYDRLRRADAAGRSFAIDLLNRSLLSDFLPVQGARGLGLYLLDRIGPLRRAMMREGVAPRASMPRLMRGERL
jgi:2-octaprenyl-6-methoxyphenol hydroxylase